MSSADSRDVQVTFTIKGVTGQKVYVRGFEAREAMSQLFQVDLELATDRVDPESGQDLKPLELSKVTGAVAWLTLENNQGTRVFHGVLSRLRAVSRERKLYLYSATLVPRAWRLLHRKDCRIFQGKTLKQIVEKVLGDAQVTHRFRLKGNKQPPKRDYCVQYQESDWHFVSRLLEEEGFFYYFQHTQSDHVLQISNDSASCLPIAQPVPTLEYHPGSSAPAEEHVFAFTLEERVRSGKVTLNDYNYLKPDLSYKKDQQEQEAGDLEVYEYPSLHPFPTLEEQEGGSSEIQTKDKHGSAMPQIRLQEQQATQLVGQGGSDSIRFNAGFTYKLSGFFIKPPGAADNGAPEYLLTMVIHRGEKHGDIEAGATQSKLRYSNAFACIPKQVIFRPPRVTFKPFVRGAQTATVTGPSGSEIYTDKLGRVKVQFHWDRLGKGNETSSCWVRVSQAWAGQSWGAVFIPRIGHEVIVDFLEGDPDRPIVTGSVYHATNKPPYLPEQPTRSGIKSNTTIGGGGYNEICFDDDKGKEQIITHAQKDQNETVRNNLSTSVGGNQNLSVGKNRDITVEGQRWTKVKGYDNSSVEGNQDYSVDGPGGAALHVLNDYGIDAKSVTIEGLEQGVLVDGTPGSVIKGKSSVLIDSPKVTVQNGEIELTGSKVTITIGTATITVDTTGITVEGGPLVTLSGQSIKLNC